MKKLIGDPSAAVEQMIDGLAASDARLARVAGQPVVVRAGGAGGKVALISGGGSGHEPAHAGYVGEGMLTAAVLGAVFTSPSVDAVLGAIRAVTGPAGCLLIVKNYTGDRLNFGLAASIARNEGLRVEMVLVDDDAALPGASRVGRRGLAGTVLIHKIAGAAAAAGQDLVAVKAAAEAAIADLATMGIGLTPCTVPGATQANFTLGEDEIEFGLGIHGEPGVARGTMAPVEVIVGRLFDDILAAKDFSGTPLALLVNGLGSTPPMELTLVARSALGEAKARGLIIERVATGTFLSALDMAGCSLSLLRLNAERLALLDAPSSVPAWNGFTRPGAISEVEEKAPALATSGGLGPELSDDDAQAFHAAVVAVTTCLIDAEELLTAMDREVGDGDLGISLARGARAVQAALTGLPFARPAAALEHIAEIVRRTIGGTSGPLNAALLVGAAGAIREQGTVDAATWAAALAAGTQAISHIGGAHRGDRTMLDGLIPAAETLASGGSLGEAATAAMAGAESTATTAAAVGRSSYLGDRVLGHADPGAWAVALWLRAAADALDSAQ